MKKENYWLSVDEGYEGHDHDSSNDTEELAAGGAGLLLLHEVRDQGEGDVEESSGCEGEDQDESVLQAGAALQHEGQEGAEETQQG